jgi:hypothetical protein
MFNLTDKDISYIIINPSNESNLNIDSKFLCDKVCNILYSKEYTIFPITEYYNGDYQKCFIAVSSDGNDRLRKDSQYLIEEFNKDYLILKYKGEDNIKKLMSDGSESLLNVSFYENSNDKVYLYNGVFFSFKHQKRYQMVQDKKQLKDGMVIEFNNNDEWIERKIVSIDSEYEKLYKLLIKYNKLRVCID